MIYIQLIGVLAFLFYTFSYSRSTYNKVLLYQMTANFLYGVHYFLLGGISGAFICIIDMLKDVTFMNLKKNRLACAIIFIVLYTIISLIFYEAWYSFLPMISCTISVLSLVKNEKKYVLLAGAITMAIWIPYNFLVHSYTGVVTELIIGGSAIFNLIRMKKQKE